MIDRILPTPRSTWSMGRVPTMSSRAVTEAQRECINGIALDIFTTMVNSGAPFAACIAAVYVSGLEHGAALDAQREGE